MLFPKKSIWLAVALSVCFIATNTALAHDDDRQHSETVNCWEPGASVQDEIDDVKVGRDTTIFIMGFCDERVTITRDGITLSGNKDGSNAIGDGDGLAEVTVTGARRVQIEYLKITGAGSGVNVIHGATATIIGNNIYTNTLSGVEVNYGSSAVLTDNDITGNGENGIFVGHGSQAHLLGGNAVSGNGEEEIFVSQSSSFRAGVSPTGVKDTFTENEGDGIAAIHVKESASVDIRNSDILCTTPCTTAVVSLFGSTFRAQNNTSITGNIFANHGGVRVQTSATFSGKLTCISAGYSYGFVSCGQTCFGEIPGTKPGQKACAIIVETF